MVMIRYISADGAETVVEASEGETVMQAAMMNGVDGITGECGGSCMCATCHCYIDEGDGGKMTPISDVEVEMLDSAAGERRQTSRLSCQLLVTAEMEGLTVRLPEVQ